MPTERFAPRPVDGAPVRVEGAAADVVTTPQKLQPASLHFPTKAGTPVDGDIVGGAADGDVVFDTTALKIWVRVGGVWKSVTVA